MMSFNETTEAYGIDPVIQSLLRKTEAGITPKFSSADEGDIPVIAIITDIGQWRALKTEGLKEGVTIKETLDSNEQQGKWIVTARIPIKKVKEIHDKPFVETLKAARKVKPTLKSAIEDMKFKTIGHPTTFREEDGGKDVVVGIVDFGCDFAHPHFKKSAKETRLLCLWDQSDPTSTNGPNGYGRLYSQQDINDALKEENPYGTLGYEPGFSSHGTHVMDIAAGNGFQTGYSAGVAPKAELIFVELSTKKPETIDEVLDKDFGDSVRLIEAVHFIFQQAKDKPCVVNLSLGTNGGPHDGTNPVERALDAMVREKPNRAVVIAAANSYADEMHKTGTVTQDGNTDLYWNVSEHDKSPNEMEIWYSGKDDFTFELRKEDETFCTVKLGETHVVKDAERNPLFYIVHRKDDPNNHDNVIHIFHDARLNPHEGNWIIRLHGQTIKAGGRYHAWIERDDYNPFRSSLPSSFIEPDPTYTLGTISCGKKSIVVGSYDPHTTKQKISFFSSSGPTRDGRHKPEVSAPGQHILAAFSNRSVDPVTEKSGTSMAAPAVTGLVALLFAKALQEGKDVPIDLLREILSDSADSFGAGWDPRYGEGRITGEALNHPSLKK